MSGVATAIGVGAVLSSSAARSAASIQGDAAANSLALQSSQYQQQRADQTPWREAGLTALNQLSDGTAPGGDFNRDFTLADFTKDPGYDFRLKTGSDAITGSALARGGMLNGGTLKALTRYGQDFGSNEYNNAYARFNNDRTTRFNRLAGLAGIGQTATNMTGQLGAATTNNMTSAINAGGNAAASGVMGSANAITSGINNGISSYQNADMMSYLRSLPRPGATPAPTA